MNMLQVALIDLRPESPTFGRRNTIYVGNLRPWQILIPPGVAHGYKVVGTRAFAADLRHGSLLQPGRRRPHRP